MRYGSFFKTLKRRVRALLNMPFVFWHVLVRFYHVPARMDALANRIDKAVDSFSKSSGQQLEALLHMQLLQKLNPDLLSTLVPALPLPDSVITGHLDWCFSAPAPRHIKNAQASAIITIAEKAKGLPQKTRLALLLEAEKRADDKKSMALRTAILRVNNHICDDALLFSLFERFSSLRDCWAPGFERVWGVYISALLRNGEEDLALSTIRKFCKVYPIGLLVRSLPAAYFAYNNGFAHHKLEKAAFIMDEIARNNRDGLLVNMFTTKSIAVVGNSPHQTGLGTGSAIDAHDLVLRFNLVKVSPKNWADYGSRTDIWSVNAMELDYSHIDKNTTILLCSPVETAFYSYKIISALASAIKEKNCRLLSFPLDEFYSIYEEIYSEIGYVPPSSGLKLIRYITKLNPHFPIASIYGFSHTQKSETDFGGAGQYHFEGGNADLETDHHNQYKAHSLHAERAFLQKLFLKEPCGV